MKMDIPTLLSIKKLAPVEYEVMDGASMRGRPKLFDSLGYAYNLRRTEGKSVIMSTVVTLLFL